MKDRSVKQCDKCRNEIVCNVHDIENCACSDIELFSQTREFLAKTYFNCLCNDCLDKLNHKIASTAHHFFPTKKEKFLEDVHYYREGNMWVFTELYHILKGSCCGNGCRHCPYGFTKASR